MKHKEILERSEKASIIILILKQTLVFVKLILFTAKGNAENKFGNI